MRNIMEKDVNFIKEFTSKLNLFGINAEQVIFLMESCGNIHRLGEQDIDDLNAAEHKRHQDFLQEEEYNAYYHKLNNPEPDEEHKRYEEDLLLQDYYEHHHKLDNPEPDEEL